MYSQNELIGITVFQDGEVGTSVEVSTTVLNIRQVDIYISVFKDGQIGAAVLHDGHVGRSVLQDGHVGTTVFQDGQVGTFYLDYITRSWKMYSHGFM